MAGTVTSHRDLIEGIGKSMSTMGFSTHPEDILTLGPEVKTDSWSSSTPDGEARSRLEAAGAVGRRGMLLRTNELE